MQRIALISFVIAILTLLLAPAYARVDRNSYYVSYGVHYVRNSEFYPSPLDERAVVLAEPVSNDFQFEVSKLVVAPSTTFMSVEGRDYARSFAPKNELARQAFEHENLNPPQLEALSAATEAANSDIAYDAGKVLPPALRAYTSGAVAFRHGDFQPALVRFNEALAADGAQPVYKVWAEFMLGRTYAKLGTFDKARESFSLTRDMVTKGAADPLGLAAASYGEEARLALDQGGGVLNEGKFNPEQPNRLQQFHEAIRLYVLQAQTDSQSGFDSLHILCKDIKNVPSDFTLLMQDELARRLFLDYLRGYNGPHGGVAKRKQFITALLPLFPAEDKDIADSLAASAYEIENFESANRYTSQKPSAYSTWVNAKLALHAGDREKAATLYDAAFKQQKLETGHPSLAEENTILAQERATLTLVLGQYVKAFEEFYELPYGGEALYLANRILTVDELQHFIDTSVPESATIAPPSERYDKNSGKYFMMSFQAQQIRDLLAHRLMRIGKYHEALPYFTVKERNLAAEYVKWLDTAGASSGVNKAEALYKAAAIMREKGGELMGYELIELAKPDNTLADNPYITQGERDRMAASRTETSLPSSFRRIATTQAVQAADLLPPKSQAFAAVLCHTTNWIRSLDEDESEQFYLRYVRQGAIVPWATHFGHHCPEPNFSAAKYQPLRYVYMRIRKGSYRHPRIVAATLATVVILVSGALVYRRRRNKLSQK